MSRTEVAAALRITRNSEAPYCVCGMPFLQFPEGTYGLCENRILNSWL